METHVLFKTIAIVASYVAIVGSLTSIIDFLVKRWVEKQYIRYIGLRYVLKSLSGERIHWQDLKKMYDDETGGNLTQGEGFLIMEEAKRIIVRDLQVASVMIEKQIEETQSSIPGKEFTDVDVGCYLNLLTYQVFGMFGLLSCLKSSSPGVVETSLSTLAVTLPSLFFLGSAIVIIGEMTSITPMVKKARQALSAQCDLFPRMSSKV